MTPSFLTGSFVKLRADGFTVYDPDMTMFTWAGGGVHCMCQPLNREAA